MIIVRGFIGNTLATRGFGLDEPIISCVRRFVYLTSTITRSLRFSEGKSQC